MNERTILHSDLNNFYASVESLYHPELKGRPIAVLGDPETRHGIVLAKNYEAKAYNVATGDTMFQAERKCPGIVFLPPHFELYEKYSKMVREIYCGYTDKVESFGLDECWLDVTGSRYLFGTGSEIADKLRRRVKSELGLTVSVGVSFNKIFAKLGSDMKKPDATTVIESGSYKEKVWKLPVNDLLFVGRATYAKLEKMGVFNIGQLAQTDPKLLRNWLGKQGITLWRYANGMDDSPVADCQAVSQIKSVGNSSTAPRDLVTDSDLKILLMALCEHVSARLRKHCLFCWTVQVSIRYNDLNWVERQGKLDIPNRTSASLFKLAWELVRNNRSGKPVRSLGVRACDLECSDHMQLSLFEDIEKISKNEKLDSAVDSLRRRYGSGAVVKGLMLTDKVLSSPPSVKEHSGISFGR